MNTPILLLGAYAAGAASGVGAMYLYRPRPPKPIPSDWLPRALEFNKAVQAEIKRADPSKPYVTGLRSPFAPRPKTARNWLARAEAKAADATLEGLAGPEPSRSKIEPTGQSRLPSIGWGKPDAK